MRDKAVISMGREMQMEVGGLFCTKTIRRSMLRRLHRYTLFEENTCPVQPDP